MNARVLRYGVIMSIQTSVRALTRLRHCRRVFRKQCGCRIRGVHRRVVVTGLGKLGQVLIVLITGLIFWVLR